jgi:glycylpeptide N-tetradecanoyltransferase
MTEKDVMDPSKPIDDQIPEHEEGEEEEEEAPAEYVATGSKQKKKKKKSKAARALAALKGKDAAISQEVVDKVLQKVKEDYGEDAPGADEATVRQALDYLKINDVIKGKAGLGGKGKKDMGEHKVCEHQFPTCSFERKFKVLGYATRASW